MADTEETVVEDRPGQELPYADSELLEILKREQAVAIGFDNSSDLLGDRERALNYYRGVMPDVPALENRSKAVSSDISDAIETALPDLVEIFVGGDDVVAFTPNGPEDEDAAEQETEYLKHVIFQENDGFMLLYTGIKDALLSKTGVWTWWWEKNEKITETKFQGKNLVEVQLASQDGEITDIKADTGYDGETAPDPTAEPTYSFTLISRKDTSCIRIMAVPPEDFAVAPDTVRLRGEQTTYCSMRSRPRAQDLIADGVDADKVSALPSYTGSSTEAVEQARDTVEESNQPGAEENDNGLRQVEVYHHFLRHMEGKKAVLWCIRTDRDTSVILDKEEVSGLNFAAITPFPITHRFYGRSLADVLIELQKINTVLTRTLLDSCYFALNQRLYIDMNQANDWTVSDVLRQEPGSPVRGKGPNAVTPIQAGSLNFDPYAALEYFKTVGEGRTGIVRNAQGLNPDTLHDTAKGALALMAAAQKRMRMIARIFAETGLKDLFLGVHATIRENDTAQRIKRLRNKWVPVNPSEWAERNDMTVEVGLGASGKDHDLMISQAVGDMTKMIVEAQGGPAGPVVGFEQIYNQAHDSLRKLGVKKVDQYLQDPAKAPPQPPRPDPEMAKVQGDQALQQQKLQGEMQMAQMKVQSEQQIAAAKAQAQAAVSQQQNELEHARMVAQQQGEMALEQVKISSQERIAIEVARINAEAKIEAARISAKNQTDDGASAMAYQESHETSAG